MTRQPTHNDRILDQFSRQAVGYGALTGAMSRQDREAAFATLIEAVPEDVALDVCCGTGALALGLAPHVVHVTGLDLTPAMLAQAQAGQVSRGATNVDWVVGDVFHLPFGDGSFSLVTCGAAFHHMPEPRLALAEMARVCRKGGRIVVRDVTPESSKSDQYDRMERLRDPSHTHALTQQEMVQLGDGLPLDPPALHDSITADLPLEPIIAASFPEECSIAEIRAMIREDAEGGEDRLGFSARIIGNEIHVSYRQTTAVWARH